MTLIYQRSSHPTSVLFELLDFELPNEVSSAQQQSDGEINTEDSKPTVESATSDHEEEDVITFDDDVDNSSAVLSLDDPSSGELALRDDELPKTPLPKTTATSKDPATLASHTSSSSAAPSLDLELDEPVEEPISDSDSGSDTDRDSNVDHSGISDELVLVDGTPDAKSESLSLELDDDDSAPSVTNEVLGIFDGERAQDEKRAQDDGSLELELEEPSSELELDEPAAGHAPVAGLTLEDPVPTVHTSSARSASEAGGEELTLEGEQSEAWQRGGSVEEEAVSIAQAGDDTLAMGQKKLGPELQPVAEDLHSQSNGP